MAIVRRLDLKNVIPLINKQSLFAVSWGMKKRKQSQEEIMTKFNAIYDYLCHFILHAGIKGIVYYDMFDVAIEGDSLIFKKQGVKWTFPRINKRCITDSAINRGQVALQVVTLGRKIRLLSDLLEREERYSMLYYYHGFSVWLTEALADYHHQIIHKDWNSTERMERYSFGYPLCPDIAMQQDLFNLLKLTPEHEVALLPSFMMVPEQSTSAIIFH